MTASEEPPVRTANDGTRVRGRVPGKPVRMTLRVSRDSGRTRGRVTEVREDEHRVLLVNPGGFPPCACPRCTAGDPRVPSRPPVES